MARVARVAPVAPVARVAAVRSAFTLIELMVVVTITSMLIAMLLPAIARVRDNSRLVQCASNMHQIASSLRAYAAGWGRFPLNISGKTWSDDDRIGAYIRAPLHPFGATGRPGGGVLVCPNDGPQQVLNSYAMNAWASSKVDPSAINANPGLARLWPANVSEPSRMMLLVEAYSYASTGNAITGIWYYPNMYVGTAQKQGAAPSYAALPTTAGARFGGDGGINLTAGVRFGKVTSELAYYRHRVPGIGSGNQARGRLNIAYADGHVESRTDRDLVNASGASTGNTLWMPTESVGM